MECVCLCVEQHRAFCGAGPRPPLAGAGAADGWDERELLQPHAAGEPPGTHDGEAAQSCLAVSRSLVPPEHRTEPAAPSAAQTLTWCPSTGRTCTGGWRRSPTLRTPIGTKTRLSTRTGVRRTLFGVCVHVSLVVYNCEIIYFFFFKLKEMFLKL